MDERTAESQIPILEFNGPWRWDHVASGTGREALATALAKALPTKRWFGSKTRSIRAIEILEAFALEESSRNLIVAIQFNAGPDEVYQVPLKFLPAVPTASHGPIAPWVVVRSSRGEPIGILYDALADPDYCQLLLTQFHRPVPHNGVHGTLVVESGDAFAEIRGTFEQPLSPQLVRAEQSNTSIIFGDRLILKVFRRVERGLNPDFEISQFLTQHGFAHTPAYAGAMLYRQNRDPWGLAILQAFVPNQGDAWSFTLGWLHNAAPVHTESVSPCPLPDLPRQGLVAASALSIPTNVIRAFGEFLPHIELLGRRTGEMHLCLASDPSRTEFAPEPFTNSDRRSYFSRAGAYARETFAMLRDVTGDLTGSDATLAARVLGQESRMLARYASLSDEAIEVHKIRIHGDYHLGQVLATGRDFVVIDFEGEPVRSIPERREKQLALRDVAGMIRSLHYASCTAATTARTTTQDPQAMAHWMQAWYAWGSVAFLNAYRRIVGESSFLPRSNEMFQRLLDACLLEKAIYELRYELNNRPDWVYLPLTALGESLNDGD